MTSAAEHACTVKDWAALVSAITWPSIVVFALLFFRATLVKWVSSVTNAELMGVKLTRLAETTKTTTAALLENDSDFERIEGFLDWNQVALEVKNWALEHKAANPSDMGINKFKRFLYDKGLPGGKNIQLEWEPSGALKYQ